MRLRENPVFGRKVFFINPPFVIEKKIAEYLKEQEYEVYIIKNYRNAKSVLRYFEHAMCFINIDDDLTLRGWYNFIKSFEEDPQLKSIFIGIMALKTPEETVKKYVMNLSLPGGYIPLSLEPEELVKRFDGILDINGAKGSRKYLSLTCNNVEALTGYIAYDSKLFSMKFENISSIGITCSLPPELSKMLKKNTVLDNVSLSLGRWSVITKCVVLSLNTFNNEVIAILLFTRDIPNEVRTSIRKFIYEILNKQLNDIIKVSPEDLHNYALNGPGGFDAAIPDLEAETAKKNGEGDVEDVESLDEEVEKTESSDKKADDEKKPEDTEKTSEEKAEESESAEKETVEEKKETTEEKTDSETSDETAKKEE